MIDAYSCHKYSCLWFGVFSIDCWSTYSLIFLIWWGCWWYPWFSWFYYSFYILLHIYEFWSHNIAWTCWSLISLSTFFLFSLFLLKDYSYSLGKYLLQTLLSQSTALNVFTLHLLLNYFPSRFSGYRSCLWVFVCFLSLIS